ncbi:hypothetical protein, partial [Neisseria bergeri]
EKGKNLLFSWITHPFSAPPKRKKKADLNEPTIQTFTLGFSHWTQKKQPEKLPLGIYRFWTCSAPEISTPPVR